MPKEIEFLRPQKESDIKRAKTLRFLNIGSIILLIFYCLVLVSSFSFLIYLTNEVQSINSQIAVKKKGIEELKRTESLQFVLKHRLSSLTDFFSKKKLNYSQLFSYLEGAYQDGLILDKVELSKNGQMIIVGTSSNVLSLSRFLEILTTNSVENPFLNVVITYLSRQKEGGYSFSLSLKTSEKI